MNRVKMKLIALALAAALPAVRGAGFGVGAFPLSPTVVSMWLLRTDAEAQPSPVVLVYFTGTHDWHNRSWKTEFEGNVKQEGRTTYRLSSETVTLELAVSDDKTVVWVQGREFWLDGGNVFVVKHADQGSAKEVVETLGLFRLPYSSEQPLAALVLQNHPELAEKLE